jgi:hypothetical protein
MNRFHPMHLAEAADDAAGGDAAPAAHATHQPVHMRRRAYSQLWIAPELGCTPAADGATEE